MGHRDVLAEKLPLPRQVLLTWWLHANVELETCLLRETARIVFAEVASYRQLS